MNELGFGNASIVLVGIDKTNQALGSIGNCMQSLAEILVTAFGHGVKVMVDYNLLFEHT